MGSARTDSREKRESDGQRTLILESLLAFSLTKCDIVQVMTNIDSILIRADQMSCVPQPMYTRSNEAQITRATCTRSSYHRN